MYIYTVYKHYAYVHIIQRHTYTRHICDIYEWHIYCIHRTDTAKGAVVAVTVFKVCHIELVDIAVD